MSDNHHLELGIPCPGSHCRFVADSAAVELVRVPALSVLVWSDPEASWSWRTPVAGADTIHSGLDVAGADTIHSGLDVSCSVVFVVVPLVSPLPDDNATGYSGFVTASLD